MYLTGLAQAFSLPLPLVGGEDKGEGEPLEKMGSKYYVGL